MRARLRQSACQLCRAVNALRADIGDDGAAFRNGAGRDAHQFQLLGRFEQRAFAGQRSDDETGERRARPLLEVMLDLDAIHGARVIERRRNRRIDSLNFHLTYMFSIDIECAQEDRDLTIADLWEAGCTGIVELDAGLRVFFDDDARQPELQARFGGEIKPADTRDWVAFAHEYLKPMEIGQRIFVCPEWRDDPTPAGAHPHRGECRPCLRNRCARNNAALP